MKEISVKLGVVFLIAVIFLSINVGVKKDETIKGTAVSYTHLLLKGVR